MLLIRCAKLPCMNGAVRIVHGASSSQACIPNVRSSAPPSMVSNSSNAHIATVIAATVMMATIRECVTLPTVGDHPPLRQGVAGWC